MGHEGEFMLRYQFLKQIENIEPLHDGQRKSRHLKAMDKSSKESIPLPIKTIRSTKSTDEGMEPKELTRKNLMV